MWNNGDVWEISKTALDGRQGFDLVRFNVACCTKLINLRKLNYTPCGFLDVVLHSKPFISLTFGFKRRRFGLNLFKTPLLNLEIKIKLVLLIGNNGFSMSIAIPTGALCV